MGVSAANVFTVAVRELKDNSILPIDADTEKAGEISAKLFQPVGRWNPQVIDRGAGIQQVEFLRHAAPEFAPDLAGGFRVAPVIDIGGRGIPPAGGQRHSKPGYTVSMDNL